MTRRDHQLLAAWLLLPLVELWFALQGFTEPRWWQVAFEILGCGVLGMSQVRFVPEGWLRSPAWPGAVAVGVTLAVLGPESLIEHVFFAIGVLGVAALTVWGVERRLRLGWSGMVVTVLAGVLVRYIVLERGAAAGVNVEGAVANAGRRLLHELLPLPSARAGAPSDGVPVVVISLDTMRYDHMTRMRSWQRLAARGVAWERAMSTSSWTLPAMASLQTGVAPAEHGATSRYGGGFQGIDPSSPALAEELAARGYTTGAVLSNAWLEEELGFARGFQKYHHTNASYPHRLLLAGFPDRAAHYQGENVTDRALAWLAGAPDQGAYLWVHYVDAHLPYHHTEEGTLVDALGNGGLREGVVLDDAMKQQVRDAYQVEVDYLDAEVGRLLDALEARGFLDRGVVVLTADHGEEFWDHGGVEHGHSHHGEVVDVGLVLVAPGVSPSAGRGVASLVDVPSTIRAVAGIPTDGVDLRPGAVPPDRVAIAYGNAYARHDRSARQGDLRVVVEGEPVLRNFRAYDLATDPLERAPLPLPDDHPLIRAALGIAAPAMRDAASINSAALEALGYLPD